jgi:hypothetical protein
MRYIDIREAPVKRQAHCEGGKEHHLPEGAVMVAFGLYLLENGASEVYLHPDGEHAKRHDLKASLEAHRFHHATTQGSTKYAGLYTRGNQTITIIPKSGLGDVVARINGTTVVAECKGGVVNSRHAGQLSRLRRGLCEAVGLLIARPLNDERHVAVVPATNLCRTLAFRMLPRATAAGIEIALVSGNGEVTFVNNAEVPSA